jgi:Sulfotransferase family
MLRQHPRIFMPDLKEPRFMASDAQSRFVASREREPVSYPKTLADYLALFDDSTEEQLIGEATTLYLWSRTAAARIAELAPDARIIAILREPASFLRSLHLQLLQGRIETESNLRKALSLESERRAGLHIPTSSRKPGVLQYSEHVCYVEQLRRYHDVFAPEQILVLIYDDFRADNAAVLRRVLGFLGLRDDVPIDLQQANVTTQTVRSWWLKRLLRSLTMGEGPISRSAKPVIKTFTPRRIRRGAVQAIDRSVVNASPPAPDERLMAELRRRFLPEVVALSEYLDRDLVALWGYDELA